MNTDFFGKEERKQMLERIERIELANRAASSSIASINDKISMMMDMLGESKVGIVKLEESETCEMTGVPAPTMAELQAKRDAEFKATMDESRKHGDELFEMEIGVLKEIRSGITETNSLLESIGKELISQMVTMNALLGDMSKKLDGPQPYFPSPNGTGNIKFTDTMPKGTTGGPPNDVSCDAKPYIPKSTYSNDTYDGSPNPLRDDSMTYVGTNENKEDDNNGN